ncbi:MAG: GEVED domain-containing protein [Bacteroidota bacterium]|nr:GEVED domain-containing protein [Bacteroidota bacterium]
MQQKLEPIAAKLLFKPYSSIPSFLKFKATAQPSFEEFMPWFKNTMGLDESFELKLLTQEADQIGYTHYRYQQLYNGLLVENTMYLIHVKNGKVVSMNGLLYDNFNSSNSKNISESDALKSAIAHMNAKVFMWDDPMSEQLIKMQRKDLYATWYPKGEMVYVASDYVTDSKRYRLAFKFDIYAIDPMSRQYVFVDAQVGEVLAHLDRIHTADTPVTAKTAMSGTQQIITDYYAANSFRLRETKRGNGVETYNMQKGTSYGSAVDFTDADTLWNNVNSNKDEYATDAHFGSEMTYDYYKNVHGRNSINGSGFKLISYIHYSSNYSNAFWNGSYMTYGDGNGSTINPLVSLDIAGHEITHGLTTFTAGLNYSYESGALNESFSDCLGTAIEWYGDSGKFEWDLATKIGWTIRSMANPKSKNQPDTYYGQNWYTGAADNGGVHTNSGVQNYWFYLLSEGDTGTNDNGDYYNVDSIGIHKAGAIAFRTLTYYLYSSAQYDDARTYSLLAAEDLFGTCSNEMFAVAAAWHAVGIGSNLSTYTAATLLQNTQNITPGTNNNVMLRINVTPACNATDTAFSFSFNTNGTSNVANIKNSKLYYTGVGTTFNTITKFGSTVNSPSGSFAFNGSQELVSNSDNYFWLVYDIDSAAKVGDSLDAECTSIDIDTVVTPAITAPAGFRLINYCIPTMTYGCFSGGMCISNFEVSDLANNTGTSCNSKAYNDYTNKVVKFEQGITYNSSIAVTSYNAYINIWIDFDDDGNFNNTNEQLLNKYLVVTNSTGNTTITIPAGAAIGYHRMRVRHQYAYSYTSLDACADGYYGEIEDYTANVLAQSNMVYNSTTTFQITPNVSRGSSNNEIIKIKVSTWGSLSPLKLNNLYLNSTGTTNLADVSNAKVYYTGTNSTFSTITQVGATVSNPGSSITVNDSIALSSGFNYFWIAYDVRPSAVLGNLLDAGCDSLDISGTIYMPDSIAPYGSRKIYYCVPATSYSPCTYMYINNVTIDSINSNSGCSPTSFSDFTNLSTATSQGDYINYNISLYAYNMYIGIWVDFNDNGLFDSAEQVVKNQLSTNLKASGTFAIPTSTSVGQHVVRVTADYYTYYNTTACSKLYYGETEDYMLNVDTMKNMNYISSATTQNTINVQRNTTNNQVIGIKIYTVGVANPLPVKSFQLNSTGTTDSNEIRNAKIWYTGSSPVFAATTQFGSNVTYPGNNFTINDSMILTTSGCNYFWLTYDIPSYAKLNNHIDAGCDSVTLGNTTYAPDTNNPNGDRKIYYCIPPNSLYPCYMYMSNVVLDSISKTSGCSSTSYSDYTSSSTTTNQGEYVNYNITSYVYAQYINIWVDFNSDGTFDSTERVVANQLTTSLKAAGSFLVPNSTLVGKYQVRIRADYYTSYAAASCSQFSYGETEDYTLNVDTIKSMFYISAQTFQNKKSVQLNTTNNEVIHIKINTKGAAFPIAAKSFTFYTTGTTNTNDISNARLWYTGTDSNYNTTTQFGSTISSPSSSAISFTDSITLQTGSNFFWISYDVNSGAKIGNYIDATCTAFKLNTASYTPDTAAPYGSRKIDYCTPTGGVANYYNNNYQWGITKVSLNNLSKSSGVPTSSAAYYTDYSANIANLVAGTNYSLYVTPGSSSVTYPQATIAWVDWNSNAVFDSTEELGRNTYHQYTDTIPFTVPSGQAQGSYRLRIMSGYYYYFYTGACKFNPCFVANTNLLDVGECEDYTIDIASPPNPVISPNSNIAFCIGIGQQYSTGYDTGYTYRWYKNGSTLLSSGKGHPYDSLYYNPSSAGTDTIIVKVTDSYGQSTTSAPVIVAIAAKAVGGTAGLSASSICSGDSVSLTLSGSAGSIIWQYLSAGVWTSTGSSANPHKVGPANNTSYRAYVASSICPNDSSNQITVTVSPKAIGGTASLSVNTICAGDSVALSLSSSSGNIAWQYFNGSAWVSLASSANPYKIAPVSTIIYRAYLTSGVCAPDSSNQVTLTVNSKAVAGSIAASSTTICNGDSVNLAISNNIGNIDWQYYNGNAWQSIGSSANSIYVSPTVNTDYRALITAGLCGTDTSKTISIIITPAAVAGNIFASASSICPGDSAFFALTGNTGTIEWQYDNSNNWQNLGSSANNIYVLPTVAASYRALVTSGKCGTDTSKTISITINPKAIAGTASTNATSICPGASTDLLLAGNTGSIDWQYYNGTSWVSAGNTSNSITVSPTAQTNYRAVVSTLCGMDSSNIISINIYNAPQAFITPGGPKDLCSGDSIMLTAGTANVYNWSTGETTPAITIKQTTTLTVTIIDNNGCTATSLAHTFTFHTPATPIITQQGDTLIASPAGATSYVWKLAGNITGTTSVNHFVPIQKGLYTVAYIDSFGCTSPASLSYNFNSVGIANVYYTAIVRVWPNPSNDGVFNLIATVGNSSHVSLRITDITGKLLSQEARAISDGNLNTTIDLSNLAHGIYLLYIDTENEKAGVPVKLVR